MEIVPMNLYDFEKIKLNLQTDFDNFWNANILKDEILKENSKYIICKQNNEIIGFAGISIILKEAELMNIVVRKDKQNKGIGKILLKNIIEICKKNKIETLKLEVNKNNIFAIKLYKSIGFKLVRN